MAHYDVLQAIYFNPRSHERSDVNQLVLDKLDELISIHAPTRGATKILQYRIAVLLFQSTLPREERLKVTVLYHSQKDFNPRSHERSDRYKEYEKFFDNKISIHAPTRGATNRLVKNCKLTIYFNPRSHERSDTSKYYKGGVNMNFNPRSHERSDNGDLAFSTGGE